MTTRAQLSIFMLLGVIILIAIIALFMFQAVDENAGGEGKRADFTPYFSFLESCLEKKAAEVITELPRNGGSFEVPVPYMEDQYFRYPLYLDQGSLSYPDEERVNQELATAYRNVSAGCIPDLEETIPKGINVSHGEMTVQSTMTDTSVIFEVSYPVTLALGDEQETRESFRFGPRAELKKVHAAVSDFIIKDAGSPDGLCWTCLSDTLETYGLKADMEVLDGSIILFSFVHNETDMPIQWVFTNDYG